MNLLPYSPNNIEEIKQLFTKVFSDSEGQSEGLLIGNLAYDLMTSSDAQDLYGFVAIENEEIIEGWLGQSLVSDEIEPITDYEQTKHEFQLSRRHLQRGGEEVVHWWGLDEYRRRQAQGRFLSDRFWN